MEILIRSLVKTYMYSRPESGCPLSVNFQKFSLAYRKIKLRPPNALPAAGTFEEAIYNNY